jgi:hypothetical protein
MGSAARLSTAQHLSGLVWLKTIEDKAENSLRLLFNMTVNISDSYLAVNIQNYIYVFNV